MLHISGKAQNMYDFLRSKIADRWTSSRVLLVASRKRQATLNIFWMVYPSALLHQFSQTHSSARRIKDPFPALWRQSSQRKREHETRQLEKEANQDSTLGQGASFRWNLQAFHIFSLYWSRGIFQLVPLLCGMPLLLQHLPQKLFLPRCVEYMP